VLIRTVIAPTAARVTVMLSGDLHHYARYQGEDRQLIHCGGGGAYLYPTHHLPAQIQVPPPIPPAHQRPAPRQYQRQATYPSISQSRRYSWGVFGRLPRRNPGFIFLLGLLHVLFALSIVEQLRHPSGTDQRLVSIPVAVMSLMMLGGSVLFAMLPHGQTSALRWALGLGHGLVHIGLGIVGAWIWWHSPWVNWTWPLPLLAAAILYLPISGLLATQVFCLYLLVAGMFGVNLNELFASQAIRDRKSFLRLHLARDGSLTMYPLGVDRVGRRWRARPEAAADQPWWEPTTPVSVRLIEAPITLDGPG
jgi:hypothetical protein